MRGEADWLLLFGSGCYRRELLERRDRPHLEAFDRRRRLGQYYAGIHRFAYARLRPEPDRAACIVRELIDAIRAAAEAALARSVRPVRHARVAL
jgi:hypothetical protein